jgi:hypothetical protein
VLDDGAQRRLLLGRVLDRARDAEDHDRAVVGRVVHRRARQDQPVDQRHRQARRHLLAHRSQCAAGDRAVAVDGVAVTGVQHRHDDRLAVRRDDPEVRDQGLVEDRVDHLALVAAAFALAPQPDPVGSGLGLIGACSGHSSSYL